MDVLTFIPVIGDFVQIGLSGYRLMDRALNGEKEQCYRTGWELKGSHGDDLKDCPPGKSTPGLICLDECYGRFPITCGIMCTANEDLCPNKVMGTLAVVNAAVTVGKAAGDIAAMNVVGFLSKGLMLID